MNDSSVNPIIKEFINTQDAITIDKYSGKGGFGELYFGQRVILKDRVALKFYELEDINENHIEPLLLKEIVHENILPIYDAKVIDNSIAYYLTPEISGGDLQNIIDKFILKTDIAVNIVQGVLKGLNELHKDPRNLVHRDIKTLNVLIDKSNGKPYLADFGTVKQIPPDNNFVTASKFSFLYSPPEALTQNQYFKESDIYQVGIILFQSLGGFFPMNNPIQWLNVRAQKKYNSLNDSDKKVFLHSYIKNLIVSGKIITTSSLPNFINRKLIRIINSATNKDISKRFKNCSEFLKALYDCQKNTKSWWIDENNLIHAFHLKKEVNFRIVKRKEEFVVEAKTKNGLWRKRIGNQSLKLAIEYIETL